MVLLSARGTDVPAIAKVGRIAIICDNFSPHLTTAKDIRVG